MLLSGGPAARTAYDQAFTAVLLGFPLVEGDDLVVEEGRVWMQTMDRLEPVDVILRYVDTDLCDPLELSGSSTFGVPGLLQAARRGDVAVVNGLGSGVLEHPGLAAYLPKVARALLGEDLLLPSLDTWWCGDDQQRAHVLANLDSLVLRPALAGPEGAVVARLGAVGGPARPRPAPHRGRAPRLGRSGGRRAGVHADARRRPPGGPTGVDPDVRASPAGTSTR